MIEMVMPAFTAPWALVPWQPAQLASYAFFPSESDSGVAATRFLSAAAAGFFGSWLKSTAPTRTTADAVRIAFTIAIPYLALPAHGRQPSGGGSVQLYALWL